MSATNRINRNKGAKFLYYDHKKNIADSGFKINKKFEYTAYSIVSMFMDILGTLTHLATENDLSETPKSFMKDVGNQVDIISSMGRNKREVSEALNIIFDGVVLDKKIVFIYRSKDGLEFEGNPREALVRFSIYILSIMEINYNKKFNFEELMNLGIKVLYEEKLYNKDYIDEIKKIK